MADLTKKYFDKRIRNLVTKEGLRKELKNFATKDDLKNFATKDDLRNFATKNDLDKLAAMISRGFEEVIRRLDVRERVEELEKKVSRIMEAINLRA